MSAFYLTGNSQKLPWHNELIKEKMYLTIIGCANNFYLTVRKYNCFQHRNEQFVPFAVEMLKFK